MVNRNGSNNGNGNGHKPDAAIVGEHDPASSAGLALLWDGLPPAVTGALGQPIDPGLGDERERELALKVAGYFDRYAPALPYLRSCSPGIHYHAVAYWGGHGTDPFGRFDTRIEAESFVGDAEMVRAYGKLEAIECSRTLPLCRAEGGRP